MKYRHEWKHEINFSDMLTLRQRLSAIMKEDSHALKGVYKIRSLYFDNLYDKALREKIDGVNTREKFRLRFYNYDTSFILLEKKEKINGLCRKESCPVTSQEVQRILDMDLAWMKESKNNLCVELYSKIRSQGLKPKTIVDYIREPFVFAPGNVRVTIDHDIRTGIFKTDFLSLDNITLPAGDSPIILEVKWDEYLPDIIKKAVNIPGRMTCAFSKYEQCRVYG